ncbi:MAG TPA: hypothetical protein VI136_14145 [Verrucomicrobiae bacterium]
MSNIQINLSTTIRAPDDLSATFAANVGVDDTVVFGPGSWGVGASGAPCPAGFEDGLLCEVPFYYDPARGNLLMDVRVRHPHALGHPVDNEFAHDGMNQMGDSISRVYAWDADATVATQVDSSGIITEFGYNPVPSLTVFRTNSAVAIRWPGLPLGFVLEWTDGLDPNARWQRYTNEIYPGYPGAIYQTATVPVASLGSRRFFRLVCESCRLPP